MSVVSEPRDHRLRRLRMRSMRRGIREMDIILVAYAEQRLDALSEDELDTYDAMLEENDQELYAWVIGRVEPPARYASMIGEVSRIFQK